MKKFTDKINESNDLNDGVPSAAEWLDDKLENELADTSFDSICGFMRKYAKLHVEKALEEVYTLIVENDDLQSDVESGRVNISDIYPLENIK